MQFFKEFTFYAEIANTSCWTSHWKNQWHPVCMHAEIIQTVSVCLRITPELLAIIQYLNLG